MKLVKKGTKLNQQLTARAKQFEGTELSDVYGKYSSAKGGAMEYCKAVCKDEGGMNFHICSYNSNFFTVAWEVENGIRMETYCNSYLVEC